MKSWERQEKRRRSKRRKEEKRKKGKKEKRNGIPKQPSSTAEIR